MGVAVGKEMAAAGPREAVDAAAYDGTVVYYMHGIPCVTCTRIDNAAEEMVNKEFAADVAAGRLKYFSLNYLEPENDALANKYKVGSNIIIVSRTRPGQSEEHVRLDRVMELSGQRDQLDDYIRQGIRSMLDKEAK